MQSRQAMRWLSTGLGAGFLLALAPRTDAVVQLHRSPAFAGCHSCCSSPNLRTRRRGGFQVRWEPPCTHAVPRRSLTARHASTVQAIVARRARSASCCAEGGEEADGVDSDLASAWLGAPLARRSPAARLRAPRGPSLRSHRPCPASPLRFARCPAPPPAIHERSPPKPRRGVLSRRLSPPATRVSMARVPVPVPRPSASTRRR